MWCTTTRVVDAPSARAASTNSFSRSDRHPAKAADHRDDEDVEARLRPRQRLQGIAKQIDDEQQQRQLRQRQEQIGQPHQRRIDAAARNAGQRANDRAGHDRDQHRSEPHRKRNAPAIKQAGQQILAKVIGAERMLP